jgi:hypothetical protein
LRVAFWSISRKGTRTSGREPSTYIRLEFGNAFSSLMGEGSILLMAVLMILPIFCFGVRRPVGTFVSATFRRFCNPKAVTGHRTPNKNRSTRVEGMERS